MFFIISNRTVQNPQNLNENIIKKTKRTQSKTYCFFPNDIFFIKETFDNQRFLL